MFPSNDEIAAHLTRVLDNGQDRVFQALLAVDEDAVDALWIEVTNAQ